MVDAAAIAADVAARYGVAVCPSVVQLCPPCTFAATVPVWDGRTNTLVYPDAAARKAAHKKAIWAGAARARAAVRDPVVEARRNSVARRHGDGLSVRQIAEVLDISYSTSLADHRWAGLVPNAYVTSAMTQSAVRAARVAQLHGMGWTAKAIAAHLGVTDDTVRDLALTHHGLRFVRKVAVPVARVAKAPKVAKVVVPVARGAKPPRAVKRVPVPMADILAAARLRKARVADSINQGMTMKAIAVVLAITDRQVRRDCRDLGIEALPPGRWREKQAVAA